MGKKQGKGIYTWADLTIMETIRDNVRDIPEADLKFMTYFVEERLRALDVRERAPVLEKLKEPQ